MKRRRRKTAAERKLEERLRRYIVRLHHVERMYCAVAAENQDLLAILRERRERIRPGWA